MDTTLKPGSLATLVAETALIAGMLCVSLSATASPPPLLLANNYEDAGIDLSHYWVSEKFDGVRAYWDGDQLLTRAGNRIHAPQWFTHGWPAVPMDGELWAGRSQFEQVTSTVRDLDPDDTAWRRIHFMVFDLPTHGGTFGARLNDLKKLLASTRVDQLREVPQSRIADEVALYRRLDDLAATGGEGLMLHRDDSLYRAERSDDLLKLKPYQDADAQVVAHLSGQGKYAGMLGALLVRDPSGTHFRIGTGFTDQQRRDPPPVGTWVTYSYHGITSRGIPRFARFLRPLPD